MNLLQQTKTLCCAAGLLLATVLAGCGGGDGGRDPILGLPAADLVSVTVTPATSSILVGNNQQLTATASYSDGTSRNVTTLSTWTSATPAVASIGASTGLARGVTAGSSAITAAFGSRSGSATLTVTPLTPVVPPVPVPVLASLAVTPATASILVGATQQYTAIATYSDNSTAVVTNTVTWNSGATSVASIAASGIATGVAAGTSTITASSGGRSANATLTVTAPVVVVPPVVEPPVVVPPVVVPPVVVPPVVVPPVVVPPIVQPPVVEPPVVITPPVVTLRRAANFAVLAGTSITNNAGGTTLVTGDVGAPSQTVAPPQAAGFNNYTSGAPLTGALEDLMLAIEAANNNPCTVSSAAGIDLGGLVLAPGVYCYSGPVSITGTFTMSGPGLYIFRMSSTLNTTANSAVAFTGGAESSSVFWVPEGATTLGANSTFKGNILSKTAAITLGDNATVVNGRVLSGAAVTLRNNKVAK